MSRGMGRGRGGSRGGASAESRFPANFGNDVDFKSEDPEKVFPDWDRDEAPEPPTEEELEVLKIAKAFRQTMVASVYHLSVPEVKKKEADKAGGTGEKREARPAPEERTRFVNTPADPSFFPEELRQLKDPSIRPANRPTKPARDMTGLSKEELDRIEQEESTAQKGRRGGGGVVDYDADGGEGMWEEEGYDEEEMEEETDYQLDYYADDDGIEEGGDGGEDSYY